MRHLEGHGGLADVAVLRLVCKAWHAAFREYPGSVGWFLQGEDDLSRLCKMLPDMARLKVQSTDMNIDLQPISMCRNLTHLRLDGDTDPDQNVSLMPAIDLSLLPRNLKELKMKGVIADRATWEICSSQHLTKLDYLWAYNEEGDTSEVFEFLPYLPKIQVRRNSKITDDALPTPLLYPPPCFRLLNEISVRRR